MILNEYGQMVEQYWLQIPEHFPHADNLSTFAV